MSDAFIAHYLLAPRPGDLSGASRADGPPADAAEQGPAPNGPCETFAAGVRAWLAHVNLPVPPPPPPAGVPVDVVLAAGRKRVRWTYARRPGPTRDAACDAACDAASGGADGETDGEADGRASTFAEVVLRRPDPADRGVIWTTRATAVEGAPAMGGGPGVAAIVVRVSSADDRDRTGAEDGEDVRAPDRLALPPILLPVLGDRAVLADANGEPFHPRPVPLAAATLPDFVDHVLCDPRRARPVVVLTPDREGRQVVPPPEVAREFFGLADVYLVQRPADTFTLTDALGDRMLSVFWGAMRVYGPGFTRSADPYAHPLLFPERAIERPVRDALRRRLAHGTAARWRGRAETARIDARLDVLRMEAVLRVQVRAEVLAELAGAGPAAARGAAPTGAAPASGAGRAVAREREEVRLDALRAENARLRAEVAALRRRAPASSGTLEQIVALASERYGDALYFLPSAYRTARASPYRRPEEVLRLFEGLARVARQCQQGAAPGGVYEACRAAGLDYASGAAESTSARLRAQYVFHDGARAYTCAEHLRRGVSPDPAESLRIYFTSRDLCDERFVVGHVGAHLRTMTTN